MESQILPWAGADQGPGGVSLVPGGGSRIQGCFMHIFLSNIIGHSYEIESKRKKKLQKYCIAS